MSRTKLMLPCGMLVAGVLLNVTGSYANIKYNKLEKRTCITCHKSVKGEELNSVGKCYQKKKTLAGCEPKS